jgi:nucleotide-binding universal stress UspA family protein
VLVVPDSWQPPQPDADDLRGMGPVVVGLEPTPPAFAAAHAAHALAALLETSLEMRHVVPPPSVLSRWSTLAETAQRARVEEARTRLTGAPALRDLATAPLEVTSGTVAEGLADAVRVTSDRRPLLVLGRRTHGERGGAPGSVAARVLTLSQAPVLMYLPDR